MPRGAPVPGTGGMDELGALWPDRGVPPERLDQRAATAIGGRVDGTDARALHERLEVVTGGARSRPPWHFRLRLEPSRGDDRATLDCRRARDERPGEIAIAE